MMMKVMGGNKGCGRWQGMAMIPKCSDGGDGVATGLKGGLGTLAQAIIAMVAMGANDNSTEMMHGRGGRRRNKEKEKEKDKCHILMP